MPKEPRPTSNEFSHLHLEIETVVLNEVRRLNPGYGEVSQVIRALLKEYLRHARRRSNV
jgi:hypothetical protein